MFGCSYIFLDVLSITTMFFSRSDERVMEEDDSALQYQEMKLK